MNSRPEVWVGINVGKAAHHHPTRDHHPAPAIGATDHRRDEDKLPPITTSHPHWPRQGG